MPASTMNDVLQQLRHVMHRSAVEHGDGQLLERYLSLHDRAALEVLIQRHAPMVWGTCRRVLGDGPDAEDAFQATFLVLVRKAHVVRPHALVGNWLYGVAHRTALKARATAAKRRGREKQVQH